MQRKIKVLQLGSPTGLYGAERWILALIRHLNPEQIQTWVVSIKDAPGLEVPLCQEAQKLGFKSRIFSAYGKINFSSVKQLRKFIVENKIDILHTHAYKQDMVGLAAVIGTSCKIISTPHGWSKEPDPKLWCYEMLDRVIFPFFDAVVPLSEELYNSLKWIPGLKNKLKLIRNGVDISEIDSVKKTAPEINFLKEQGKFILGYIGQLIHRKGIDVLLRAAAQLPTNINWHLFIVGEGKERKQLQHLTHSLSIQNRVEFLGFRRDRLALLKSFDVFVLPSRLEGIPRCLMEAMAARVPVVTSNIPGCTDLVIEQETGLLFPVDDIDSLRRAIEKVIYDPSLTRRISKRARSLVMEHFSAEKMARSYAQLYISMVKE